jgi:glutamate carboxypeptidase
MNTIDMFIRAQKPYDPATSVEVTGGFDRPPLERTDGVVRLYEKAGRVAKLLGYGLSEGATGGGSDGNFTAALGVPTLDGLGAIGGGAHALDEHIHVESVPDRAALLAGLIATLDTRQQLDTRP